MAATSVLVSCFALCAWFGRSASGGVRAGKRRLSSEVDDEKTRLLGRREESVEESQSDEGEAAEGNREPTKTDRDDSTRNDDIGHLVKTRPAAVRRESLEEAAASVPALHDQPPSGVSEQQKGRYGSTGATETADIIKSTHFNASFAAEMTVAVARDDSVADEEKEEIRSEQPRVQPKREEHAAVVNAQKAEEETLKSALLVETSPAHQIDDSGDKDEELLIQIDQDEPKKEEKPITAEIKKLESTPFEAGFPRVEAQLKDDHGHGDDDDKVSALAQSTKSEEKDKPTAESAKPEDVESTPLKAGPAPTESPRNGIAGKLEALFQPTKIHPQQEEQRASVSIETTVSPPPPSAQLPLVSPKPTAPRPAPKPAPRPAPRPKRAASDAVSKPLSPESPATPPVPAKPVVQARKQVLSYPNAIPVLPVAFGGKGSPPIALRRMPDISRGMGNGSFSKNEREAEVPISFDEVCNNNFNCVHRIN